MKKCFELTPCLLAFLCITSCVEDVDNERSKGMFSASQSGFTTIEVYDLGPLTRSIYPLPRQDWRMPEEQSLFR